MTLHSIGVYHCFSPLSVFLCPISYPRPSPMYSLHTCHQPVPSSVHHSLAVSYSSCSLQLFSSALKVLVLAVKRGETKAKQKKTRDRNTVAYHRPTEASQSLSNSNPRNTAPSPSFMAEHVVGWLWKMSGSAVPAVLPLSFLSTPSLLEGHSKEREKALTQCEEALFTTAKTRVCYQHCLGHKSKMQHPAGCYEES